jgi:hypothetical protein
MFRRFLIPAAGLVLLSACSTANTPAATPTAAAVNFQLSGRVLSVVDAPSASSATPGVSAIVVALTTFDRPTSGDCTWSQDDSVVVHMTESTRVEPTDARSLNGRTVNVTGDIDRAGDADCVLVADNVTAEASASGSPTPSGSPRASGRATATPTTRASSSPSPTPTPTPTPTSSP